MRTLYPPIAPYHNGTIAVDDTHTLFYQIYGSSSQSALTALFLHGGPGAGCSPNHARFFDPSRYRVVLLDQRGSGYSTPRGEVHINNTLSHLVQDCDTLQHELGLSKWDVVLGGSWGSTLALAYAQAFPSNVRSLVLRGVCLMRPAEIDWLFNRYGGAAAMNRNGWMDFSRAVGVDPSTDMGRDALHAHYDRLLGDDIQLRWNAARSWMQWEMSVAAVARNVTEERRNATREPLVLVWDPTGGWGYQDRNGNAQTHAKTSRDALKESQAFRRGIRAGNVSDCIQTYSRPVLPVERVAARNATQNGTLMAYIPAQPMLTCYYSVNSRFALDNVDLLTKERIERIRKIRCISVQGGLDLICPPDSALDLHSNWPEMELRIPMASGHSMYDEAITNELIQATDRLATEFHELMYYA